MPITLTAINNNQLDPTPEIEQLFYTYSGLTKKLEECASCCSCEGSDERADELLAEQSEVIRQAVSAPTNIIREILFKITLWRWDAPDLEALNNLDRHNALAYSVFRDLVNLTGASNALTEDDERTSPLLEVN